MNTKTVRELRSIAKDKGLHGYYKLKKADLVALLLEQSSEEIPTSPPRASGKETSTFLHRTRISMAGQTAAEYCGHEKGVRNVKYAPTSSGLSCLRI